MTKEQFLEAMTFRHACKQFDEERKIPAEDLAFILDVGRRSPSSFGIEHWKFLVIQNSELKAKIRPFCWDQPQITTCSDLVVVLAKIDAVKPQNPYVKTMLGRFGMPEEKLEGFIDLYANHLAHTMSSDENILAWSAKQCYIALGNMMTAAAAIGIDSCPIEGFDKKGVEAALEIDTNAYQLAVILPLGYRVDPQSVQHRLPTEAVVEYIR